MRGLGFLASDECVLSVVQCGGKEIGITSLSQTQLSPQFLDVGWEVTNGEIRLVEVAN